MAIGRPVRSATAMILLPLLCPRLRPHFLAVTSMLSIKHSDESILSRVYKSLVGTFRIRTNTPDSTRAWKYRWQVERDRCRLGMSTQAAPVHITHKMPFISSRGLQRGRPLPLARRGGVGISGSIRRNCVSFRSISGHLSLSGDHVLPFF